jgi:hypothetical protein
MESPILFDVWTVEEDRADQLRTRISELLRELVVERPGFVSAELYESIDRGVVMLSIRMQTVAHRQALVDSPQAHRALRELREIAHSHSRLLQLVETFRAGD